MSGWISSIFSKKKLPQVESFIDLGEEVLKVAQSQIGVYEQGGDNKGPEVVNYLAEVGLEAGNPWCSAFAIWCIHQVEKKSKKISKVYKSGHVMTMWRNTPESEKMWLPKKGAIAIWRYGDSEKGHCGIVESVDDFGVEFVSIEGNSKAGNPAIVREGDCVDRHTRSLNHSDSFTLLGFIKPFPQV